MYIHMCIYVDNIDIHIYIYVVTINVVSFFVDRKLMSDEAASQQHAATGRS